MRIFYAKVWPEGGYRPVGIVLVAKDKQSARRLLTPNRLAKHGLPSKNFDGSQIQIAEVDTRKPASYILSCWSYT